jgi:hypothetical protein
MEPTHLPHTELPHLKSFEDVELGNINAHRTGISTINFPGYHDSEPGAPHDPNHQIPIDGLPPRPLKKGRDWKGLLAIVPWSALGSVASAVAAFFKTHAAASQNLHLLALYSIIGTLTTLLGVAMNKLGPPQIFVNYPGAFLNCSNVSTTTVLYTVTVNQTTISSNFDVTTMVNHTSTDVHVTVGPSSGSGSPAASSEVAGSNRRTTFVTITPPRSTVTSVILSTTNVAPTRAAVTITDLVTASPSKRSVD